MLIHEVSTIVKHFVVSLSRVDGKKNSTDNTVPRNQHAGEYKKLGLASLFERKDNGKFTHEFVKTQPRSFQRNFISIHCLFREFSWA
jgi:hypothetical protein